MRILVPVTLALVLLVATLAWPVTAQEAPVVHTVNFGTIAITGTQYSRVIPWAEYKQADVFYQIDMSSGAQTMTVKLQVSPDTLFWVDHSTKSGIYTGTADASGYIPAVPVEGYYFRLKVTTSDNKPVTSTYKIVLR